MASTNNSTASLLKNKSETFEPKDYEHYSDEELENYVQRLTAYISRNLYASPSFDSDSKKPFWVKMNARLDGLRNLQLERQFYGPATERKKKPAIMPMPDIPSKAVVVSSAKRNDLASSTAGRPLKRPTQKTYAEVKKAMREMKAQRSRSYEELSDVHKVPIKEEEEEDELIIMNWVFIYDGSHVSR